MINVIIPFTVKEDAVDTAKNVIRKFIYSIKKHEAGTLMYKSLQQADQPVRFVHVMTFMDEQARQMHRQSPYCKEFIDTLYPLCIEPPEAREYREIV